MSSEGASSKWVKYFLRVALATSMNSPDQRTKVGAVIVGAQQRIISTGFNGFPAGWDPKQEVDWFSSDKYGLIVHAEANALLYADRASLREAHTSIYVTHEPCIECAKLIAAVGIKQVFIPRDGIRDGLGIDKLSLFGVACHVTEWSRSELGV
jgi:dCMP deaminase